MYEYKYNDFFEGILKGYCDRWNVLFRKPDRADEIEKHIVIYLSLEIEYVFEYNFWNICALNMYSTKRSIEIHLQY